MKELTAESREKNTGYPVRIGANALNEIGGLLEELKPSKTIIISNAKIMGFHGQKLKNILDGIGVPYDVIEMPDGEQHKNHNELMEILQQMVMAGADRKSMILSFGGGVVGDMAGFASSVYMRGIRYIQIPTTLLSQVDSSIGGKTGIDLPAGKNLIGAFYNPLAVLIDPLFLSTLEDTDFYNGFAEIIKASIIDSPELFSILEGMDTHRNKISTAQIEEIIYRAAKIKMRIVNQDMYESGIRMYLNLGHTVGHALESVMSYRGITHGKAVAMGMMGACHLSRETGILEDKHLPERLNRLCEKFNLFQKLPPVEPERVMRFMEGDKKFNSGMPKFILPVRCGQVKTKENIDRNTIMKSIEYMLSIFQEGR